MERYSAADDSGHFTQLMIDGLRGFSEPATLRLASPNDEVPGSGLTIVVGPNSAGKTTVWEAFDALGRAVRSGSADAEFSQNRRNATSAHGVRLRLQLGDETTYAIESLLPVGSRARVSRASALEDSAGNRARVAVLPARRQFPSYFGRHGLNQVDWMTAGGEISRSRTPDQLQQFAARLFVLQDDPEKKRAFDDLLERIVGERLEWSIDLGDAPNGGSAHFVQVNSGQSTFHTSEGLGDGIVSLLFIIDLLYEEHPGTLIVIDEPELSLHPQLIQRLGEVLAERSTKQQIVIFTHAPRLVSWHSIVCGAEIARVFKKDGRSQIAQPDRSVIDEIDALLRDSHHPHILGGDATEALFLDERVLVMEGQEDVVYLPRVLSDLKIDLKSTPFGWGAGGASKIRPILLLLQGLGFRRVAALLDGDTAGREQAEELGQEFPDFKITCHPANDIRTKPHAESKLLKPGLLDDENDNVRSEYREEARKTLESIGSYMSS